MAATHQTKLLGQSISDSCDMPIYSLCFACVLHMESICGAARGTCLSKQDTHGFHHEWSMAGVSSSDACTACKLNLCTSWHRSAGPWGSASYLQTKHASIASLGIMYVMGQAVSLPHVLFCPSCSWSSSKRTWSTRVAIPNMRVHVKAMNTWPAFLTLQGQCVQHKGVPRSQASSANFLARRSLWVRVAPDSGPWSKA